MKRLDDYQDIADHFDMDYLGPADPPVSTERVKWRCNNCTREFYRSYRQMRRRQVEGKPGCRCQGKQALKAKDYHALAKQFDLVWTDNHVPPTTRSETTWYWKAFDITFKAAYHELREGIPSSLRQRLLDLSE